MSDIAIRQIFVWQIRVLLIFGAWTFLQTPLVYLWAIGLFPPGKLLGAGTIVAVPVFIVIAGTLSAIAVGLSTTVEERLSVLGRMWARYGAALVPASALVFAFLLPPTLLVLSPAVIGVLQIALALYFKRRDG